MPVKDHVDVRLLIDGKIATELKGQDVQDDENTTYRYVQIKAGQTWAVAVHLKKGFDLQSAEYVGARVCVDGDTTPCLQELAVTHPHLACGNILQSKLSLPLCDKVRSWKEGHDQVDVHTPAFGALGTVEGRALPKGTKPEDVASLGSIRIQVCRLRQLPANPGGSGSATVKSLDIIGEDLLKGREIKANTKFVPAGLETGLSGGEVCFCELDEHSQVLEFVFLYRTKTALENLGVIERTPPPAPDFALQASRYQEMANDYLAEVKRLKAENERLKDQLKIAKVSAPRSGLVRDQALHNDGDDDLEVVVTSPPKKPREIIDLDDD